jgi:hypothetical protein
MTKKKELTEEQKQEIQMLINNNKMLDKTKAEAKERGKMSAVKQIERAQQETIDHIKLIDPTVLDDMPLVSDNTAKKPKEIKQEGLFDDNIDVFSFEDALSPSIDDEDNDEDTLAEEPNDDEEASIADMIPSETTTVDSKLFNEVGNGSQFDMIQLPSNGQCYKSKTDRVPVSYLTAYDENIITSPNLYKDGLVIDYLLKNKIETNEIKVDELVSGDADAIILYLRATSYGAEFPIVVSDPQTGEQFDTVVDLTKLKPREFKLIGDENGFFDFETPLKHDKVKFRYLTRKQERQLKKITELESYGVKANMLMLEKETLLSSIANDEVISEQDKKTIRNAAKVLENWSKKLAEKNPSQFTKIMTNTLLLQVVSVNGNTDRAFIKKWVMGLPARDSLALRRYINDNRPGINFDIEVERPESLGGGSFTTFLNWDDTIFLNISNV